MVGHSVSFSRLGLRVRPASNVSYGQQSNTGQRRQLFSASHSPVVGSPYCSTSVLLFRTLSFTEGSPVCARCTSICCGRAVVVVVRTGLKTVLVACAPGTCVCI